MAAQLPITGTPLEVSTDPVDVGDGQGVGHAQRMKLLDGRNEGTSALVVEENGALREPCAVATFAGFVTIGEAGGYTAGQAVGAPVDLGVLPSAAMTRHLGFTIASLAGAALPALDVFVVQTPASTTVGDFTYGDGDPFDPPINVAAFALGANAAAFEPAPVNPLLLRWSEQYTRQANPGDGTPPRWFLSIRAGETFADDLTAGVVVSGFVELVTPSAVTLEP